MRRLLLLAVAMSCVCAVSLAEDDTPRHDGIWWSKRLDDSKIAFIVGYIDGYNMTTDKDRPALKMRIETYGTIDDGVKSCYSDFKNQSLTVGVCLWWVELAFEGHTIAQRETYLERERKIAHEQ